MLVDAEHTEISKVRAAVSKSVDMSIWEGEEYMSYKQERFLFLASCFLRKGNPG